MDVQSIAASVAIVVAVQGVLTGWLAYFVRAEVFKANKELEDRIFGRISERYMRVGEWAPRIERLEGRPYAGD